MKKLLLREWTTASIVIGLMGSVLLYSWTTSLHFRSSSQGAVTPFPAKIFLTVEGAVEHPGSYSFNPGVTLKEVLAEVRLTKSADRKKIVFNKVFYESQTVTIPQKSS